MSAIEKNSAPVLMEYSKGQVDSNSQSEKDTTELESGGSAPIDTGVVAGYVPTPEEQIMDKKMNLKMDIVILPLLAVTWQFSGMDKSNIGNALTDNFIADTGFNKNAVSNAVSMTAVTIVLCPFLLALGRRVGARNFIGVISIGWSLCTIGTAYAKTIGVFYFVRILQSVMEGAYFQLACFILSTIYPRYDYGIRLGFFTGQYAFAGAFSSLIAYGCFHMKNTHLYGWQLLFIIEGSISLGLGMFLFFVLPGRLEKYWVLNKEERVHAIDRMARDTALFSTVDSQGKTVKWRDVKEALDWKKLILIIGNTFGVLPVVCFSIFCPVIVQGMGYKGIRANLMSVTPYLAAFAGILVFVKSSDRFKERSIHTCVAMVLSIIGLAVMISSKNNILRYIFLHVCLGGAYVPGPLILAWLSDNTPDSSTRILVFGINGFTGVASVISGQLFKSKYAPSYKYPLTVTMVLLIVSIVLFMSIRVLYMIENAKRRKLIAAMTPEDIEAERVNQDRLGDKKLTFIRCY